MLRHVILAFAFLFNLYSSTVCRFIFYYFSATKIRLQISAITTATIKPISIGPNEFIQTTPFNYSITIIIIENLSYFDIYP